MKITAKIEGDKELLEAFRRLKIDVAAVLEKAALAGAEEIRAAAQSKAPGPHIEIEIDEKQSTANRRVAAIGPDKEHWFYQFFETGAGGHEIDGKTKKALAFEGREGAIVRRVVKHPGIAAAPFMRPAFDSRKDTAVARAGEVLKKAIER
jgi:HK97 gp10 family phage protein